MLKDKLAIVTGGTRGIGYAVVEKFLENHATVVLCGSRQETADRAVEALKAKNPAWPVEGIAPELTDYASVRAAFQDVAERHCPIDILVNNAGRSSASVCFSLYSSIAVSSHDLFFLQPLYQPPLLIARKTAKFAGWPYSAGKISLRWKSLLSYPAICGKMAAESIDSL